LPTPVGPSIRIFAPRGAALCSVAGMITDIFSAPTKCDR
jgi:hypothetical protein